MSADVPGADDLGFELLPADDDPQLPPDVALDAAAASAAADPSLQPVVEDPPEPFGRTPLFDFEAGRFVRRGGSPVWVTGFEALKQRVLMAILSARYAHSVFSDEFGAEGLNGLLGRLDEQVTDDARQIIRDAVLVLDRVVDVTLTPSFDPLSGILSIPDLTVVTDEDVELPFSDLNLNLATVS